MEHRGGAREKDVIEAEVQNGGEGLTVGDDGSRGADDGTGENIVPMVVCEMWSTSVH